MDERLSTMTFLPGSTGLGQDEGEKMKRTGRYKTVKPDNTKSYTNAAWALADLGFEICEKEWIETMKNFTDVSGEKDIYIKNGKRYVFVSMNHFNTLIYSIKLAEVE